MGNELIIRKPVKGYLLSFILMTLTKSIIVFILLLFTYRSALAVLLDKIVAVVNDDVITWSELVKEMQIDPSAASSGERAVLDRLIDKKLQILEAKRLGIKVKKSEIESTIKDIKSKYNITDAQLQESLMAQGLNMEDYRTELKEQILLTKVVTSEIRSKIILTDQEIRRYYRKHYDQDGDEQIKLRQIFISTPQDKKTEMDLESMAESIYGRLQGGEDFATVASELSESLMDGDLGYVTRNELMPEVANVAFSLKPGQISRPFRSSRGIHIIKVEDKKGQGSYESVKEEIKDRLYEETFQQHYKQWLNDLRKRAFIEKKLEK